MAQIKKPRLKTLALNQQQQQPNTQKATTTTTKIRITIEASGKIINKEVNK